MGCFKTKRSESGHYQISDIDSANTSHRRSIKKDADDYRLTVQVMFNNFLCLNLIKTCQLCFINEEKVRLAVVSRPIVELVLHWKEEQVSEVKTVNQIVHQIVSTEMF